MPKHKLIQLGDMKMQEADRWRGSLRSHTDTYYRAWLLERMAGYMISRVGRLRDSKIFVLLTRIHMEAHDARLDAELNVETAKKLVVSSEMAARVYFEEYEQQWS